MKARPYYTSQHGLVPASGRLLSGNFRVASEYLQLAENPLASKAAFDPLQTVEFLQGSRSTIRLLDRRIASQLDAVTPT
jgi:hypothetical protein